MHNWLGLYYTLVLETRKTCLQWGGIWSCLLGTWRSMKVTSYPMTREGWNRLKPSPLLSFAVFLNNKDHDIPETHRFKKYILKMHLSKWMIGLDYLNCFPYSCVCSSRSTCFKTLLCKYDPMSFREGRSATSKSKIKSISRSTVQSTLNEWLPPAMSLVCLSN